MNPATSTAPSIQPEEYRAMLRALCIGNWVAIAGALALEIIIRNSATLQWPQWGYFSLSYNLVLCEFALVTLGVTLLLNRTEWLDRAPREALGRLHYLLLVVLVLDGLHLLSFFHTTGGLRGPVVVLLPPILLTVYLLLPRREAHTVVGVFLLALLVAVLVDGIGGKPEGLLAKAFSAGQSTPAPWLLVVTAAFVLAVLVGITANRQMEAAGTSLAHRVDRDPKTGLFTRSVLERRIPGELGRIDRAEGSAALVLISFRNMQNLLALETYAGFDRLLQDFADGLKRSTRGTSDTCARHDVSSFAALLPTASSETVSLVIDRLKACADGLLPQHDGKTGVELAIGVATTSTASHTNPDTFMSAAREALREAGAGESGHQVVMRTL